MATEPRAARNTLSHAGQSVLAFGALALVIAQRADSRLGKFDQAVIKLLGDGRSPAGAGVARATSGLTEPRLVGTVLAATAAIATRSRGWQAAVTPCLAVASGAQVRRILSRAVARPRPPEAIWLTEPEGFSLPSKHTSVAALTAGACAACIGASSRTRHGATLVAAASVGASRVYLGVHWPSDVLAGWLFAEGWLHLAGACQDFYGLLASDQVSPSI
jgi:membrane-associated phospholipid phosphatase